MKLYHCPYCGNNPIIINRFQVKFMLIKEELQCVDNHKNALNGIAGIRTKVLAFHVCNMGGGKRRRSNQLDGFQ